jgi:hypothetical protein
MVMKLQIKIQIFLHGAVAIVFEQRWLRDLLPPLRAMDSGFLYWSGRLGSVTNLPGLTQWALST